ncbi:hypothetical protein C3Y92_19905 [Solidesulfovibrio carbinolicus]|uniref:Uncharacterized protein n=1 Tax=Solidesulfovibrio carbinolicus TaxID=296842 RepID=A0A4P6I5L0_9BACT|nr:hypothetical protein C3Y92_19905 [Solidesulfovibrio carbinolicus]
MPPAAGGLRPPDPPTEERGKGGEGRGRGFSGWMRGTSRKSKRKRPQGTERRPFLSGVDNISTCGHFGDYGVDGGQSIAPDSATP